MRKSYKVYMALENGDEEQDMKVQDLITRLGLTVHSGKEGLEREVTGGYTSDLLSVSLRKISSSPIPVALSAEVRPPEEDAPPVLPEEESGTTSIETPDEDISLPFTFAVAGGSVKVPVFLGIRMYVYVNCDDLDLLPLIICRLVERPS